MAFERLGRGAAQEQPSPVDLYYAEILTELFGFPTLTDPAQPGSQHFNRTQIGIREYDAAAASLSRSVGRLERRGLVTVYHGTTSRWTGVTLTDQAVKTMESFRSPNRTAAKVTTPADPPQSQPLSNAGRSP
jgi:hypothetical protein